MAVPLRKVLPLFIAIILIIYVHRLSIPSCKLVPGANAYDGKGQDGDKDHPDDLKVMMVADLLLLGSERGFMKLVFREYHLSKFFMKSFEILKPDMLLVLGDVSARGFNLNRSMWSSLLHQFHRFLGPWLGLRFHVVLGDRDIGECGALDTRSVNWIADSFPGLDLTGCVAFEIS